MIIKLDKCPYNNYVCSLALTEETKKIILKEEKNVLYVIENKIELIPQNICLSVSKENIKKLMQCDNYDVFFIQENGMAYRFYDNESTDNALVVTSKCNSNCVMCPVSDGVRKSKDFMTCDEILNAIHHLPTDPVHLTITGGEPFLIGEKLFDILYALREKCKDTNYLLLTNGRALSYAPYIEQFNVTKPKKIIIGIPLHGYDSKTHDYITRSSGGFIQTLTGIKNLIYTGNKVEIRIVVSKLNYKYITKIARLIVSQLKEIYRVKIMGLEMLGNAAKYSDEVWISYSDAFKAAKEGIDILITNGIDVGLYNFPLCAVNEKYRLLTSKSITDYKVRYDDKCNSCMIKDACGGIFSGSIRMAKYNIKPVVAK